MKACPLFKLLFRVALIGLLALVARCPLIAAEEPAAPINVIHCAPMST